MNGFKLMYLQAQSGVRTQMMIEGLFTFNLLNLSIIYIQACHLTVLIFYVWWMIFHISYQYESCCFNINVIKIMWKLTQKLKLIMMMFLVDEPLCVCNCEDNQKCIFASHYCFKLFLWNQSLNHYKQ